MSTMRFPAGRASGGLGVFSIYSPVHVYNISMIFVACRYVRESFAIRLGVQRRLERRSAPSRISVIRRPLPITSFRPAIVRTDSIRPRDRNASIIRYFCFPQQLSRGLLISGHLKIALAAL